MAAALIRLLKVLSLVLVVPPALLLATCTYTSHSPHLRLDPLNAALMDGERHPEHGWRTVDVQLVPEHFQLGQDSQSAFERLERADYELFADYASDVAPPDPHPNDGFPQAALDRLFAQERASHNERGVTHIWSRPGRAKPACGEEFFVEIGISEGALTQATGYSRYTCL